MSFIPGADEFRRVRESIHFKEQKMATNGTRKLFINVAVRELERSMEFFTKLGFEFNKKFTDDKRPA